MEGTGQAVRPGHWALIASFAVALTTFVVALLVINWVLAPTVIWLIAVALLSGGVVGVAVYDCDRNPRPCPDYARYPAT